MKKIFLFSLLFFIAHCSSDTSSSKTELIFGLYDNTQNKVISPQDWKRFVTQEIAPRLPKGFTVLSQCNGAWLSEQFGFTTEECKVVLIVHPKSSEIDQKILEITDAYKREFHQEAVLRLDTPVKFQLQ